MPRPFQPDDLIDHPLISDFALAPDGSRAVFSVRTADRERDDYDSRIWIVPASGGPAKPLTAGTGVDQSAAWSPNGAQIAFLSSRQNGQQLYLIDLDGGEARALTSRDEGAGKPVWSPDGKFIAFLGTVPVGEQSDGPQAKVIDRLRFKSDGLGFTLRSRLQLFVVSTEGGEPRQLTQGESEVLGPAWSPDSKQIAFVRNKDDPRAPHLQELWIVQADGGQPRKITDRLATISYAAWSPDGKRIAVLASEEPGDSVEGVFICELDGSVRRIGGENLETTSYLVAAAPSLFWDGGDHLLFLLADRGRSGVARISIEGGGDPETLIGGMRQIHAFDVRAGKILFTSVENRGVLELHIADRSGQNEKRLDDVDSAWSNDRAFPTLEERWFEETKHGPMHGWLFLPPEGPRKKLPLLVDIHGGPHSFVELGFLAHVYRHVLASKGWAVLAPNPPGSTSFGREYAQQLRGHWGELDLPELLIAIDRLIAEGLVDPDRVAIGGKSYGGFMSAWAIGHTDRFAAAIVGAPVVDLVSHSGTSDSGYYVAPFDQKAELDEDWSRFDRLSPIRHAVKAKTPTLIMQGEEDQRCPIGQSEQLFTMLIRRTQVKTELVCYPDQDHHLPEDGRPSFRADYHRRFVEWLERWTKKR